MKIDPQKLSSVELYHLMIGSIVPRPIAFISTVGENGVYNLAPFSYFMGICPQPPTICVSIGLRRGEKKDTVRNIEFCRDFVVNVVDETIAQAMNVTSADFPSHIDEFKEAGLTPIASGKVRSPRAAESLINMECRLIDIQHYGGPPASNSLVIGEIVQFHINDNIYEDGRINMRRLKAIGRMGGDFYCRTGDIFEMERPR